MSVALLLSLIEIALTLLCPSVVMSGSSSELKYSFFEYLWMFLGGSGNNYMKGLGNALEVNNDKTALLIVNAMLIAGGAMLLFLLLAVILSAAKKGRAAGVFQLFASLVAIAMMVVTKFALVKDGNDALKFVPVSTFVTPAFVFLTVMMLAGAVFSMIKPDAALGADKSAQPVPGAQRPLMYPAVTPVAPVAAVTPVAVAAPVTAARPASGYQPVTPSMPSINASPMPSASSSDSGSGAAPASGGGTYTCPVCGTNQKSDLAFCTFCGNPNPNK